jgi:hypothetical protein
MPSARDLIQESFEQLRVYAPGETATMPDVARGFSLLNQMMDSWSNENLSCYAITEQSVQLVPGKWAYTIGPGGDVDGVRPLALNSTAGSAYVLDYNQNQYPVTIITKDKWNLRGSRNTNSNFPDVLFYDPQYPLGVLNFDPIPNIGYTAFFDSYLPLSQFPNLDSQLSLPPGYQLAIKANLSVMLKPYFATAELDPLVVVDAQTSKANIKRKNIRLTFSAYDPEIVARGRGRYSIFTDGTRR